jgi:hypothetical protein
VNGFRDQAQRIRVVEALARWVHPADATKLVDRNGPTMALREHYMLLEDARGVSLSAHDRVVYGLIIDFWHAEAGVLMVDLMHLAETERAYLGALVAALATGPDEVDWWLTTANRIWRAA